MRVLMLVPNLGVVNGVSTFVMSYLRDLDKSDILVDVAAYQDVDSGNSIYCKEIEELGGKAFFLPGVKNLPKHIKACNEILLEGQYDVIHDNTLHISIPMMCCAKRAGVPVRILHSHSSKMGETIAKEIRNNLFMPVLRSLATDYVACSKLAGHAMFGKQDFTVIPNVICADKYSFNSALREQVRKDLNVQDKFVIGTVGRLAEQKNPLFAIDVFECLLKKMPNAEYWWIGSGPMQEQVEAYVGKKGLKKNIRFLGSRNDVQEFYQGMDAFFLPSLFEGLPLTGVEAQAMGLPMVVSDTVTDEMVYTDLVDYVGLGESKNVWAQRLIKALTWHTNRAEYSEKLRQSIFSNVGCGERLAEIYHQFAEA